MNDPTEASEQGKNAANGTPNVPERENDSQPPQHEDRSQQFKHPAKKFFLKFMGRPFGKAVAFLDHHAGTLTALATIFIAALTGVLAWYASDQGSILKRQAADSEITNRAFVGVRELQVKLSNGYWVYTPILENSGNTPTIDMKYIAEAACVRPPLSLHFGQGATSLIGIIVDRRTGQISQMPCVDPPDPEIALKKGSLRATIAPHATIPIGGIGISTESLQWQAGQKKPVLVYGAVKYRDAFSGDSWHVTKYCFNVWGVPPDPAIGGTPYGICPHWNCTDNECRE